MPVHEKLVEKNPNAMFLHKSGGKISSRAAGQYIIRHQNISNLVKNNLLILYRLGGKIARDLYLPVLQAQNEKLFSKICIFNKGILLRFQMVCIRIDMLITVVKANDMIL